VKAGADTSLMHRLGQGSKALLPGSGRNSLMKRFSPPGEKSFSVSLVHDTVVLEQHIREGRFQRSLALIAGFSGLLSGLEVTYEHYRGSYSQQIMYTPVFLSAALFITGVGAAVSRRVARTLLPVLSILTIVDGIVGFYFHVRGVARKPGGWRVPVMNVIMGPPVFAPLLFALSGYLGIIASLLRPENTTSEGGLGHGGWFSSLSSLVPKDISHEGFVLEQHVREGRFQKNLAAAAGISAFFSTAEALYSHYKNGFAYPKLQWSPILLGPLLLVAGVGTIWKAWIGRTLLPVASALALLDGGIGFYVHARGIVRRPGGLKLPVYNLIYGPPIFAPLLFAASGFMGLLASLLRRSDS
jgi:hypothetical protein